MLFTEEEIEKLSVLADTARILNRYYGLFNGLNTVYIEIDQSLEENFLFILFQELKINLIKYDLIINKYINDLTIFKEEFKNYNIDLMNLIDNFINFRDENGEESKNYRDLFRSFIQIILNLFKNSLSLYSIDHKINNDDKVYLYYFLGRLVSFNFDQNLYGFFKNDVNGKLDQLDDNFNLLRNSFNLYKENTEAGIHDVIDQVKEKYNKELVDLLSNFRDKYREIENSFDFEINTKYKKLISDLNEGEASLNELFGDLKLYKSIISESTENEISKHYSLKADKEKKTYWLATSISVAIIVISLGSAWLGLNDYYQSYVSVDYCFSTVINNSYADCVKRLQVTRESTQNFAFNYLVMRLIFSILLFLTVIYTSRIAIRAYSHWRHSENMHLKLASLRPFINQLQEEERNQIYKELVPDYFGKDAGLVDTANEKFKDLPANVSAVAIKAIEQISGGSSSGKAENNSKKDNEV
ncbi:hypothetical protein ACT4ZI_15185 [Acinetobacter baumannii]|nr:hypothetical protein [Acinetobacter baumannii]